MTRIATLTLVAILLTLAGTPSALAQAAPASKTMPAGDDPYLQPVQVTLADLLDIYSGIATAHMRAMMATDDDVENVELVLLSRSGKTVFDMVVSSETIADLQSDPPGSQTKDMLEWHSILTAALKGLSLVDDDRYEEARSYPTPALIAVQDFLKTRAATDVLVALRFKQAGTTYVYAEVTHDRVDFNPDAPTAKP
jgi:hypothetical protein